MLVCGRCFAHNTVRCLQLPLVNVFINRYVVLINTKLRQSELEADYIYIYIYIYIYVYMYTLSGSQ